MIRFLVLLALLLPGTLGAQHRIRAPLAHALPVEALGGTAGSLAGLGILAVAGRCGADDVACHLHGIGAVTTLTSGAGTYLAGRTGGTAPSLAGALLGALGGLLAGAGAVKLGQEAGLPEPVTISAFALGQGLVSALGSRLLAR